MDETLYRYNPWWERTFRPELIARPDETERLIHNLDNNQVIFLTGLRRIGKTSLMKMILKYN